MKTKIIDEDELNHLEKLLTGYFFTDPLSLDGCSRIIDYQLFVRSHIGIVKFQISNFRYKPYLERLLFVKDKIK